MQGKRHQDWRKSTRADKLSALEALLGRDTMDRLRREETGFEPREDGPADGARVALHRDRLIGRLSERWRESRDNAAAPAQAAAPPEGAGAVPDADGGVDRRIASAMERSKLSHEHPAVIARVLQGLERPERIALLRELPGQTARAAIQRLRLR